MSDDPGEAVAIKLTSWNIEHADGLIGASVDLPTQQRRERVRQTLREINCDILCLIEAPARPDGIQAFCADVLLNEWVPVLLPGNTPGDYCHRPG